MKNNLLISTLVLLITSCNPNIKKQSDEDNLLMRIMGNESIAYTKAKALEIVKSGLNAGSGYGSTWIRDLNTFIELAAEVIDPNVIKDNLLVFFRMQGDDGNIVDGFYPIEVVGKAKPDKIYSELEPRYAAHKNTVETDQESSLIQCVYKYMEVTGDQSILNEMIGEKSVAERMEWAMEYLMNYRLSEAYDLIWGATTADWGDVQPEHDRGVDIDENTHRAIDVYDNAMFIIALDNLIEMLPDTKSKWDVIRNKVFQNCRKYLWDTKAQKFRPHIYLEDSPFPEDFNEEAIFYHGGTAVAIEAGLLSRAEIKMSLNKMLANVKASKAGSIGLTLYPPYPEGFFKNRRMFYPYCYQNGGDWTWFGGRMIQQLIKNEFLEEAYEQLCPMTERVMKNEDFFEWYLINNQPCGSNMFRGSAGVLYLAINMLENATQKSNKNGIH